MNNAVILEKILAQGFPTHRDEAWKYTSLHAIEAKPFTLARRSPEKNGIPAFTETMNLENYIIFYNGYVTTSFFNHQDKHKIKTTPLNRPSHENLSDDVFENLNEYFFQTGFQIQITQSLEHPLQILYINTEENWVQSRNFINIEKNSKVVLIENFLSQSSSVMNTVMKIDVKDSAELSYIKIQKEHEKAFHIGRTHIFAEKDAKIETFTFSQGSQLARSDITVILKGENAEAALYGLYTPENRTHLDHHTHIEHAARNTKSDELYHGVLKDKSRAVFNGKVLVKPDAFHTEARQANHNLLLSSDAEIDTKPELEIYCDDIKCMHGATIGALDEKAIFYLQTRGLSEPDAKEILIKAFADKIINKITDKNIRELVKKSLEMTHVVF